MAKLKSYGGGSGGTTSTDSKLIRLISPRYPNVNMYSHICMPPMGLMYVGTSASLTGRYRVEVIDENNWAGGDHRMLQAERPADVVGFYCGLSSTMPRVFEVAKLYKEMGVTTIAGGNHAETLPEESLNEGIDYVACGEGEDAIVELLDAIFSGSGFADIKGLAYRGKDGQIILNPQRLPNMDLGSLPEPDFSLLVDKRRNIKFLPISRTRGCNFKCEFCSINTRQGSARVAPSSKTIAHFDRMVANGQRLFFFTDDNFAQDRDETLELCAGIVDIMKKYHTRVEITVQVRTQVARDPRLMEAMRDAGIKVLCVGIESPIPEDLKAMRKGQNVQEVEADLRALRRNGFFIHGMFILGYPSKLESISENSMTLREKADKYIQFIKRAKIDTLQVLKAVPVPGSPLADRLKNEGRIYPLDVVGWEKYDGNFVCFQPDPGVNAVELQREATRIMHDFYSPWNMARILYLGPISPFEWVFYFIRRGAQRLSIKAKAFEEKYRRPLPTGLKWGEFFKQGHGGAGIEIYRLWRNTIIRIAGGFMLRKWTGRANLDAFIEKIKKQQERITKHLPEYNKHR